VSTRDAEQPRTSAKRAASRAYDHGIREAGLTNDAVASAAGIKPTRVKSYRSDDDGDLDAVPSTADLILAPPAQFGPWLARILAERLLVHGLPVLATVEEELLATLETDATFHGAAARVLRDRVVTPAEADELARVLDAGETQRKVVRAQLARRAVRT
jgi:hypothetical protein